jgi:hypothetical protein
MSDFYSAWLERSKSNQKKVDEAPRVTRSKDLKWERTPQDHKAALMIAPELGFPTGGSCLMRAEIPVGWHTGKHFHGEEAIYAKASWFSTTSATTFFPEPSFMFPIAPRISSSTREKRR